MNTTREISSWLESIVEEEQILDNIIVLNIGIYETDEGYCLYLTGHEEYDEDNDSWAEDVVFESQRYCHIHTNTDWKDFLHNIVTILKQYFSKKGNVGVFDGRIITIGFDDGELVRIK